MSASHRSCRRFISRAASRTASRNVLASELKDHSPCPAASRRRAVELERIDWLRPIVGAGFDTPCVLVFFAFVIYRSATVYGSAATLPSRKRKKPLQES